MFGLFGDGSDTHPFTEFVGTVPGISRGHVAMIISVVTSTFTVIPNLNRGLDLCVSTNLHETVSSSTSTSNNLSVPLCTQKLHCVLSACLS